MALRVSASEIERHVWHAVDVGGDGCRVEVEVLLRCVCVGDEGGWNRKGMAWHR